MKPVIVKCVTQIVMADNHHVDVIVTDGIYTLTKTSGGFNVNGESVDDDYDVIDDARDDMLSLAINDDTPVTGYGSQSGRKYWQLPIRIQNQVKRLMRVK